MPSIVEPGGGASMDVTKERAPLTRRPRTAVPGDFPAQIAARYRIGRTMLGRHRGDVEFTIGLRDAGHCYRHSATHAGLWIFSARPTATIKGLKRRCPSLIPRQVGDVEFVVIVPWNDLPPLLDRLGARRRRRLTPEQRERLIAAGQRTRFAQNHGANGRLTRPESTISHRRRVGTCQEEIAA